MVFGRVEDLGLARSQGRTAMAAVPRVSGRTKKADKLFAWSNFVPRRWSAAAHLSMSREAKNSPKDRRAILIRDAAKEIVAHEGAWLEGEARRRKVRIRSASFNGIQILLTTPFQRLYVIPDEMRYHAALTGFQPNRPYGIDIFVQWHKMFNVEWDEDNRVLIVCFRRGQWEDDVLRRAREPSLAGTGDPIR